MAKREGAYKGWQAASRPGARQELSDNGIGPAAIARKLGMARSWVYRLLHEEAERH
jgi:hypothetical protein